MTADPWWRRLDAERWVYRVGLLAAPSVGNAVGLALDLGVLALLCHPRSRARIHGPVPALPTTAEYALEGRGR